ncbi:MAG: hypothetical protein ACRECC_12475, partial [Pseudolabrys sp.]
MTADRSGGGHHVDFIVRIRKSRALTVVAFALALAAAALCFPQTASAQFAQQGSKLTAAGGDVTGTSNRQGYSVALSTDGNTMIVGAPTDNNGSSATAPGVGSARVYVRDNSGNWTEQALLTASDETGNGKFGYAVALSGDGNTAIVGAEMDNATNPSNNFDAPAVGAAWIFIRDTNNNTWSQKGNKHVGSSAVGLANQGASVAMSRDGTTAIVGGFDDDTTGGALSPIGAAWVYVRDPNTGDWGEQAKLIGTGVTGGASGQGQSVALSADGNTALVGGILDTGGAKGAAWAWGRSGTVWTQQAKLVGSDYEGASNQGRSVALSDDGNTAAVGGDGDAAGVTTSVGALWIFTRDGGNNWTQQGNKLVGTGAVATSGLGAAQGHVVGLSADGNTALSTGYVDNDTVGAGWIFTRSGGVWTQQGSKLVGTGGSGPLQGSGGAISGDAITAALGGPQ